jgi:putative ABC transport system permease protein
VIAPNEIWIATRTLFKRPAFTLSAVFVLSLGIGANTAVFLLVNSVLIRPLPFSNPENLVWVTSVRPDRDDGPFSLPDFVDCRDQNRTLQSLSALARWNVTLTGGIEAERIEAVRVTADLFETLGAKAETGRTLISVDDYPGATRVAVLTYGFWQRRFGGSPDVVGQAIKLDGETYMVVGVLGKDFLFPGFHKAELAVPLSPQTHPWFAVRNSVNFLVMVGRLRTSSTREQAQAELDAVARRLQKDFPESNARKIGAKVAPLHEHFTQNVRLPVLMFFTSVGLVIILVWANLANLVLAHTTGREKEFAIRSALGASRFRLICQLTVESLIVSLAGGVLGLLIVTISLKLISGAIPSEIPRADNLVVDSNVLLFAVVVSLMSGLLFGFLPALQTRINFDALKGAKSSSGIRGRTWRNGLIISELAISLILLFGAGLLVKSFAQVLQVKVGFDSTDVFAFRLSLPRHHYSSREDLVRFYDALRERLIQMPGVKSVGLVSHLPLSGLVSRVNLTLPAEDNKRETMPEAQFRAVSPGYFETMGIPVHRGRDFASSDGSLSRPVAVINESLARRFWAAKDPIGAQLTVDDSTRGPRLVEIIGVVGDVKQISLDSKQTFDIYIALPQLEQAGVGIVASSHFWVLRTRSNAGWMESSVRQTVRSIDSEIAVSNASPIEQYISTSMAGRRFSVVLMSGFALVALLLAAGGVYGVVSYSTGQRTKEFGIRMALGAVPTDIVRLVLRTSVPVIVTGIIMGVAGSLTFARLVQSLLFGVGIADPLILAAVSIGLFVVCMMASCLPALRAAKLDPTTAIRFE